MARLTFIGGRWQPIQRGLRRGKTLRSVRAIKVLRHAVEAGVNHGRFDRPKVEESLPGFLHRPKLFRYR